MRQLERSESEGDNGNVVFLAEVNRRLGASAGAGLTELQGAVEAEGCDRGDEAVGRDRPGAVVETRIGPAGIVAVVIADYLGSRFGTRLPLREEAACCRAPKAHRTQLRLL